MILMRQLLVFIVIISPWASAGDFLPPDQVFVFSSSQNDDQLQVTWQIQPGYYLYKKRIYAYLGDNADIKVPLSFQNDSVIKEDNNFGSVSVFFDQATAILDLRELPQHEDSSTLTIEYQGCAKSGLCYQPQYKSLNIPPLQHRSTSLASEPYFPDSTMDSPEGSASDLELNSTGDIASFLKTAGFWSTIGVFFLLGAGLSLTPCILPMVPILSGVIVGQGTRLTAMGGFSLSGSYVLGMSVSYALIGILAASFGASGNLQLYMQNPWAISVFAALFVVLAMSMFDLYTLQLPVSWQNRLNSLGTHQRGGRYGGVFVMGALAALIASPCVSAPLAGALVYISGTGDLLMGATALFSLGIGMGIPLLALGAGGGKLIPKAGLWMKQIKIFFGVILLGVSIWLLSRIVSEHIALLLWGCLLIFYGIYTGALEAAEPGVARLGKAISFTVMLFGCFLLLGAATGGTNPLSPINSSVATAIENRTGSGAPAAGIFERINSRAELNQALAQAKSEGKLVILDFYADWCTACIDMEEHVFSEASVNLALAPYQLLQIDITDNTDEQRELMDQFGLYGPPSILFFDTGSKELADARIQGEMKAGAFLEHLKGLKKYLIKSQNWPEYAGSQLVDQMNFSGREET